jgi:hypothetical protein
MPKKTDDSAPARAIRFGDQVLPVRDPNDVQTVAADVVTEWRVLNNYVAVSLGTVHVHPHADNTHEPEVVVCARLRVPIGLLLDLKTMIEAATKSPIPKTEMN